MTRASEIVFIDPTVSDVGTLLAGLRPEVEAVLLESSERATAQIARTLRDRANLAVVHILAHGRPGEVSFGAGPLSLDTLDEDAADLAAIGHALGDGGDLRLWSCETGQGARGAAFVAALAEAAGAEVAAASWLVGAAALGGRWELEAGSDAFGARSPLTTGGVVAYPGTMAPRAWIGLGGTAIDPANGLWSVATNWSPSGVPTASDTLTIGSTGQSSSFTVTVDTAALAASITLLSKNNGKSTTVTLTSGNSITASGVVSFDSASTISGAGTINAGGGITGTGTISAAGGTLEVNGTITDGGNSLALSVGSGAIDRLLLDAASTAKTLNFLGSTGTLELNTGGTLSLSNQLVIGQNTVKLDGSSSTLTDASGVTISSGTITGVGKVAAQVTASGAAHITANGGTLEVTGSITNSGGTLVLTITGAGDKLLLDAASAAKTVTFGSSGTLELNTSGTLTVTDALAVGTGTVKLDGTSSSLTDAAGVTLSTGTITGLGKVAAAVTASGAAHITANGGTLEVTGKITNSGNASPA